MKSYVPAVLQVIARCESTVWLPGDGSVACAVAGGVVVEALSRSQGTVCSTDHAGVPCWSHILPCKETMRLQ